MTQVNKPPVNKEMSAYELHCAFLPCLAQPRSGPSNPGALQGQEREAAVGALFIQRSIEGITEAISESQEADCRSQAWINGEDAGH